MEDVIRITWILEVIYKLIPTGTMGLVCLRWQEWSYISMPGIKNVARLKCSIIAMTYSHMLNI